MIALGYRWGVVALGVVAGKRDTWGVVALGVVAGKRDTWGEVALGVVAGKETQKKETLKLIVHIITHNTKSRRRNPSNTYTKPPKFSVPSFRRVLVCNLTMV